MARQRVPSGAVMSLQDRPGTRLLSAVGQTAAAARAERVWRRVARVNVSAVRGFPGYVVRRFLGDHGPESAAGLSYASLLALVPLLAIMLAVVSAFPTFAGVEERILDTILSDLLPAVESEASARIRSFVANAKALTGPGIVGLAVTAVLLLSNVNGAFNTIWRVSEPRPLALRFLVYWALLTLGPLLLAASISATAPLFNAMSGGAVTQAVRWLIPPWLVAILVGGVGFGLLFLVVPNRPIRVPHAVGGGLVTALLFEVLKAGFALYLAVVPGYTAVYGAVAAVPIFLIWLYLSWAVVLLGAEVTAALPEWAAYRMRAGTARAGDRLALALALLARLRDAHAQGRSLGRRELVRDLPATPGEVDGVLAPLRRAGVVARTSSTRWLLATDLRSVTLGQLMGQLDLALMPGAGWPAPAERGATALAAAAGGWTDTDLERLLAGAESDAGARAYGS